jgi:Leucine-rich repeat (LRR) protein
LDLSLHVPCSQLNLGSNRIGDAGLVALAGTLSSGALPSLKQLFLQGNQISDDGFATLMPLLNKDGKLSGLTGFGIGSGITDKGMKEFADILSSGALDHLKNLHLGNNKCSQQSKDMLKTSMSKVNCSIHF